MSVADACGPVDVFYVQMALNNIDQAVSLAEYLTQHGVAAHVDGPDAVVVPLSDPAKFERTAQLRATWKWYWDCCFAELHGLPVYQKPNCNVVAHS